MDISSSLENKIKSLAEDPGVYLMKDAHGHVLYVGKAKNLKNRVTGYFQDSRAKGPRIELLVRKVYDFETVLTDTEVEALILECNLIKKYRPRFNVRLKDDKTYPYLRLDVKHPFPKLEFVRRTPKDGAKYFGPYVSSTDLRQLLTWARKGFKLRDCTDSEFRNRVRPCILHQIGQCSAPCVGLIDQKEYQTSIDTVLKILDGKTKEVLSDLKQKMGAAAENEEFERAAQFRDQIQMLEGLNESQKISAPGYDFNRDVVHFARSSSGKSVCVILSVRDGRTIGIQQFSFDEESPEAFGSDEEFILSFISQYYVSRFDELPELLPQEVLLPEIVVSTDFPSQLKVLSSALGKGVDFRVPKKGEAKDLVEMVRKTAQHRLEENISKAIHSFEDLQSVQEKLDLRVFPKRIECFDISHFQGTGTVASRVVFVDGKPDKSLYRHYHVRETEGVDDFKSMREILDRRFSNDSEIPNLVVVDGGKGQLAQAELVFAELGVIGVELASLAKARTESDFTDEEVQSSMERVFKPGQKNPIYLKPGTGAFRVLTQLRDEAHRFAITFHRKTRAKKMFKKKK